MIFLVCNKISGKSNQIKCEISGDFNCENFYLLHDSPLSGLSLRTHKIFGALNINEYVCQAANSCFGYLYYFLTNYDRVFTCRKKEFDNLFKQSVISWKTEGF